jgi:hypothetical protein
MAKTNKAADLLKLLGQRAPTATPVAKAKPSVLARATNPRAEQPGARSKRSQVRPAPPRRGRGKAIQFYLHEADEKLIREFAVWLAPHRKRINDSLVVKAVLRAAKTGPDLLAAYDDGLAVSKAHQKGRVRPEDGESQ